MKKDMNRQLSKEDKQMANKHEKMLNVINDQGNANQTKMWFHLTFSRMTIVKKSKNNRCRY